jgi:hypothetical protein
METNEGYEMLRKETEFGGVVKKKKRSELAVIGFNHQVTRIVLCTTHK